MREVNTRARPRTVSDATKRITHPPIIRSISPENFSNECVSCHTTSGWSPAQFDHNGTNFPLTGAHTSQTCLSCHTNGQFAGTPFECYACHQADFDGTTDPNHAQEGYPHSCEVCHSTNEWNETQFNHDATQFPLTGAHIATNCALCHVNGVYNGTPTDCYACHQTNYDQTTTPNHVQAGFPTTCVACHSTTDWDSQFDHNTTDFPLTGAHLTQACLACHADGVYNGKPTDCVSCHQTDYDQTSDPNHAQAGFPTTCAACHTTTNWDSQFDHGNTDFPLTGAHLAQACLACHGDGVYNGKPTDCYSCHQADYDNSSDPNHQAAGYPHSCEVCHSTTNWEAQFNHDATNFPLTGAHVTTDCAQCHINNVYEGTPTDCYACHQSDYDATNDPDHQAANFPHTCVQCHSTQNWESTFNHNATDFPLTGAHVETNCLGVPRRRSV